MKTQIILLSSFLFIFSCNKEKVDSVLPKDTDNISSTCDISKTYADNALKVTITNGIWGTVSFMQGNCMPMVDPQTTTCTNCPVKRTVRIYEYTLRSQATPSASSSIFFDSFGTKLVKELTTDDNGFFQTDLPAGKYTLVVVENGKLYANGTDGQGGLNPFTFTTGTSKVNVTLTYKAVF